MIDEEAKAVLVGYWNGKEDDPDIVFTEKEGYKLVVLQILEPFENTEDIKASNINKSLRKLKKQATATQKAAGKLDDVSKNINRLGNLMKRFKST